MADIADFLPEEDERERERYIQSKRGPRPDELPDWMGILDAQNYIARTPKPEELPGLFDSINFELAAEQSSPAPGSLDFSFPGVTDAIKAAKSNALVGESVYRRADGSIDYESMHNDQWLTDFERTYHANRGQVDLEWLLQFPDDIHLLGDSDTTEALYHVAIQQQVLAEATRTQEAEAERRTERVMTAFDIGEAPALELIRVYDEGIAMAESEIAAGISYERAQEIVGDRDYGGGIFGTIREGLDSHDPEEIIRQRAEENGNDYRLEYIRYAEEKLLRDARYKNPELPETPGNSFLENLNPFAAITDSGGVSFHDVIIGNDTTLQAQLMEGAYESMGTLGQGIGAVTTGLGWLAEETVVLISPYDRQDIKQGLESFQVGFNYLFSGGFDTVDGPQDMEATLRAQLGMSDEVLMAQMAALPTLEAWNALPSEDPESFDMFMAMANGNQEVARAMFGDALTNQGEYGAWLQEQARVYKEQAAYQLEQMENEDFTVGDALLGLISIWGEGVEMAATALTLGAKTLFEGQLSPQAQQEQRSFWQQVRDHDVPSSVFGLDGTLVGLAMDLGIPAIVDPTTWVFAPRLASTGRAGARTVEQAIQAVDGPAAAMTRNQIVDVVRGSSGSAVGVQASLDNLALYGVADEYIAAASGFGTPMSSLRPYLDEFGGVVDDVALEFFDDLVDEVPLSLEQKLAQSELIDKLKAEGPTRPVEVTVNPRTGRYAITDGEDMLRAYQAAEGVKSVPTTLKIDESLGRTGASAIDDVAAELGVVDGQINTNMAERLTRYDQKPTVFDEAQAAERAIAERTAADVAQEIEQSIGQIRSLKDQIADAKVRPENHDAAARGRYRDRIKATEKNIDKLKAELAELEANPPIPNKPASLFHSVNEVGVQKPVTLAYHPESNTAQIVNGNNRVAAARLAGLENIPVEIRIVDRGFESLPVLEGRTVREATTLDNLWQFSDEIGAAGDWVSYPNATRLQEIKGNAYLRPKHMLPENLRLGEVDLNLMREIELRSMLMGADPINAQRNAVSVSLGNAIRDGLRQSKGRIGSWIDSHITPINGSANIHFTGPAAMSNVNQFVARLWGAVNDMDTYELFSRRITQFWEKRGNMKIGNRRAAMEIDTLQNQIRGLERHIEKAGYLDELNASPELIAQTRAYNAELRSLQRQLEANIRKLRDERTAAAAGIADYTELNDILTEMVEEYNRKYIATNPAWSELVDPDTGLVPWEHITGRETDPTTRIRQAAEKAEREGISLREAFESENNYMPKAIQELLELIEREGFDIDLARFNDQVNHSMTATTVFHAPASPLEIMLAAHTSPSEVARATRRMQQSGIREAAHMAHNLWMIDKVLTPRTGIVVSLDELMRMWHTGGARTAWQYLDDKLMKFSAKVTKANTAEGFARLPERWQRRLTALEEYPTHFRQMERSFLETHGYGADVIEFKPGGRFRDNAEYYEAAQRSAGQSLNEHGWQAYFQGEDAFREWFETAPEAEALRQMDYFNAGTLERQGSPLWSEVYQGYNSTFELWYLSGIKESKKGAARKIWKEASERQAQLGSTAAGNVQLPNWVLEGFGSVTGNAKIPSGGIFKPIDWVSERLFQRPVNYRRGFLAEMVRESEWARLSKLLESQNIDIVTNAQLDDILRRRYPTFDDGVIAQQRTRLATDLFEHEGVISEQFLNEVVEAKVVAEMESQLYSFHMTSRAGRSAKALFPFGKPWADMYGFWGREMLTRPQLRGWINNRNFLNISKIANGVVDMLPINPKPAAFVSRLAATEFDLERIEDDPVVGGIARGLGFDRLDVGSAMFLPTGGESPFMTMLPGFGLIPSQLLHVAFEKFGPDPETEPLEWQQWIDQWSQFLPGMGYNRPQNAGQWASNAVLGGGLVSRGVGLMGAMDLIALGGTTAGVDPISASWTTAIAYDRQVKAAMGQQEFWTELFELFDQDMSIADVGMQALLDEHLQDVMNEQARTVGLQIGIEKAAELGVPARITTLSQREELDSVWLDNTAVIPEANRIVERFDLQTETGQREAAEAVRSHFFKLPDWQQDTIIAANPWIAVNGVGMWKWTDRAKTEQVEGSAVPYRTGGSVADMARHETYIQLGFVQPKPPREIMVAVVGRVLEARNNTARDLYSNVSGVINDWRWDSMQEEGWEEVKVWLDSVAEYGKGEGWWPWSDGRDVWENWTQANEIMFNNGYHGFEVDEEGNEVPKAISMPGRFQRWSVTMPSDFSSLRDEFVEGFPVPGELLTEQVLEQMKAIDMPFAAEYLHRGEIADGYEPTLEMADLWHYVKDYMAENYFENPVFPLLGDEHTAARLPNGAAVQNTTTVIGAALDHSVVPDAARAEHHRTMVYAREAMIRKAEGDSSWLELAEEARKGWRKMGQDDILNKLPLNDLWDEAYGRTLGAVDWEADEPSPLVLASDPETGETLELNPNASRIMVRRVVDGDTLHVTPGPGRSIFGQNIPDSTFAVRMLGVNAAELGTEAGEPERLLLEERIDNAINENLPIYIVRDPERYGNTDMYGRVFAWVYIGDEPFYRPETLIPRN